MVSHAHKFLYIHVPKTAGSSLQHVLFPHSDNTKFIKPHHDGVERFELRDEADPRLNKHAKLRLYYEVYGTRIHGYFKFAFMRNPYAKIVSRYFSPHRNIEAFDPDSFATFVARTPPLEAYVLAAPSDPPLDEICRFEDLGDVYPKLMERLRLPTVDLPIHNKGDARDYRDYFTKQTRSVVEERHAFEISLGGYEF